MFDHLTAQYRHLPLLCVLLGTFGCIPTRTGSPSHLGSPRVVADERGDLTVDAAIQATTNASMRRGELPAGPAAYWLRYAVPEGLMRSGGQAYVYSLLNRITPELTVYLLQDGHPTLIGRCGAAVTTIGCPEPASRNAFPVTLPGPPVHAELLVRATAERTEVDNDFWLMSAEYFASSGALLVPTLACSLALVEFLALVALGLFWVGRDRRFLMYAAFYTAFVFTISLHLGLWDLFLHDLLPAANFSNLATLPVLVLAPLVPVVFFDMRRTIPFWYRVARFTSITIGLATASTVVWPPLRPFLNFYSVFLMVASIGSSLAAWRRGLPMARRFTIAWILTYVALAIESSSRLGIETGLMGCSVAAIPGIMFEAIMLISVLLGRIQMAMSAELVTEVRESEARTLRSLLRVVSHDLSNTVQAISVTCSVAAKTLGDPVKTASLLEKIRSAAKMQADLIRYAKACYGGADGSHVETKPVLLATAISMAADLFEEHLTEKNLFLRVDLPERSWTVLAEPVALVNQILGNVLSNAIRFSPNGRTILISARAANGHVLVAVQDEGVGIPAARQKRLFEETKVASGMATVKRTLETCGGSVEVKSHAAVDGAGNTGTTITMALKAGA